MISCVCYGYSPSKEVEVIKGVYFYYDDDKQTICDIEDYSGRDSLTIPCSINGKTVKAVNAANSMDMKKRYKKVVLEEGIERIICIPLAEEYVFPKSLKRVTYLFKLWEKSLPNIVSYDSATTDGKLYIEPDIRIIAEMDDFLNIDTCEDYYVTEIITNQENKYFKSVDGVLYSKDMKTLVRYPFANKRESFKIPDGVEKIAPYAFSNCLFLKKIYIPTTINEIGEGDFDLFFKGRTLIFPDERLCNRDFSITLNGEKLDVNAYKRNGRIMIEETDFNRIGFQKYTQYFTDTEVIEEKTYVSLMDNLKYGKYEDSEAYSTHWEKKVYSVEWVEETRTVVIKEVEKK